MLIDQGTNGRDPANTKNNPYFIASFGFVSVLI